MNKQAILDVLNNLDVIEQSGGEDAYILVAINQENLAELAEVGITEDMVEGYGTDGEDFCILAFAFGEKYADDYENGKLIIWNSLVDDDLRYRVTNGQASQTDAGRLLRALEPELFGEKAEFGTFAAHQPGYDRFKELGLIDDYLYQALVHMGNASYQWSWANTVLEHMETVPHELKERIRAVSGQLHPLADELRAYRNTATSLEN